MARQRSRRSLTSLAPSKTQPYKTAPSNTPPLQSRRGRWPMRELEFLPAWYPQARRRLRIFRIQACSALLLIVGLAIWVLLARHNLQSAYGALASVDAQLAQSLLELDQL